jgi:hypothetical protein
LLKSVFGVPVIETIMRALSKRGWPGGLPLVGEEGGEAVAASELKSTLP